MPKSVFNDAEPKMFTLLPDGDYMLEVTECEFGIQSGGKTGGSDKMSLTLKGATADSQIGKIWETLIFHASCDWKIDLFIKAFNLLIEGRAPVKGQEIDWSERMVVGLRGWATVGKRKGNDGKEYNEIKAFITNKEKLAKVIDVDPMAAAPATQKGEWD